MLWCVARGYAYAKIKYVSVRTYLSKNRYARVIGFVRKLEYTKKRKEWKHVMLQSGKKRTALFNATVATTTSGNCLPSLLQF